MGKMDREILVVRRSELFPDGGFQGFEEAAGQDYEARVLDKCFYTRRGDAETDPSLKQPIGYAVLFHPGTGRVFAYRRSDSGGEGRLRLKWSCGLGGHIEREEQGSGNPIRDSLVRELQEEVGVDSPRLRVLGYINDDSEPVGEVHFGVLYLASVEDPTVELDEREIAEGKWLTLPGLEKLAADTSVNVENWSRIAVQAVSEVAED